MADKKHDEDEPEPWRERFVNAINEKVPNAGVCPRCGHDKLILGEDIVTPSRWHIMGRVLISGNTYPQAMLICTNCGHTSYFNLGILGVLDKNEELEYQEASENVDPK